MTSEDERPDQSTLRTSNPLKLFRIARAKYANLSGAGAALYPGRWNQLGQEAIYTSTHPATPQLEYLKHTPKNLIPTNLVMMEIHVNAEKSPEEKKLPEALQDWFMIMPSLKFAREMYPRISTTKYSSMYGFAVPSVIVPDWNVVLLPAVRRVLAAG